MTNSFLKYFFKNFIFSSKILASSANLSPFKMINLKYLWTKSWKGPFSIFSHLSTSRYSSIISVICRNNVTIPWLLWTTNWCKLKILKLFYCYLVLKAITNCSIFLFNMLEILSMSRMLWFARAWRVSPCCYFFVRISESYFWGIYWVNFSKNVRQLLKRQICLTAMLLPLIFYILRAFFSNIISLVELL